MITEGVLGSGLSAANDFETALPDEDKGGHMMEALNEFLGRTTVDPDMKLAFNQGRLEDALVDCGFTEAQAARLSEVEASDFTAFLRAFYTEVVQQVEAAEAPPHPWPSEGLARDRTEREAREEAA